MIGRLGDWVIGGEFLRVWMYDCKIEGLYGCMIGWLYEVKLRFWNVGVVDDCRITRLKIERLQDYRIVWMYDWMVVWSEAASLEFWSSGVMSACLSGLHLKDFCILKIFLYFKYYTV